MHTNIHFFTNNWSFNTFSLQFQNTVKQTGSEIYEIVNMIGIFYDTTSNSHDQAKRKGKVTRWKN